MVAQNRTEAPATASEAPDQDALSDLDLAKGVLARDFRPRAASVKRLAEAVLAKQEASSTPRKKSKKKASAGKSGGKKRKLAKIPGQKGKKDKKGG